MDPLSLQFIGFAAIVAVLYNLFRPLAWRQTVFLAANVVFLATFSGNWRTYIPLSAFLMLGYLGVWLMHHHRSRPAFLLFTGSIIFTFVWLKQYSFIPRALFLTFPYVTIGMSYIFFRVLHMVVDAKDGNLPAVNPI